MRAQTKANNNRDKNSNGYTWEKELFMTRKIQAKTSTQNQFDQHLMCNLQTNPVGRESTCFFPRAEVLRASDQKALEASQVPYTTRQ